MNKIKFLWKNNTARKLIYFFCVVVFILISLLFFQKHKMQEEMDLKVQFIEEKNMLRNELDDLIHGHDELLDEYGDLNNQLQDKDSVIQQQIAEIRNLIRTKEDLGEARRKISTLKDIIRRYLSNIDSLLVINENLAFEKDSIIKENKNINWKNYKLNKQNEKLEEKVNKGSVLELAEINVETIRYRGTGREVSTRFAKKVQKIRVCFTVAANQIADSGEKIVFMQLIDSNGSLIQSQEIIEAVISDSIFNCTDSSSFTYNNQEIYNCFEWERLEQLKGGDYLINLILEGRVSAQKQIKLR